jgi:hypothetical protein
MTEYTPTVEEVRRQWNNAVRSDLVPTRSAEFDRMIAEVEARGLEKAADAMEAAPGTTSRKAVLGEVQYLRARAQQVREGN